ncbi:hypothetical protein DIPPA_32937 [Diplonema papillatum]|nr:hypothetical protein DIPPA_32937 [Diplonema papillatum]
MSRWGGICLDSSLEREDEWDESPPSLIGDSGGDSWMGSATFSNNNPVSPAGPAAHDRLPGEANEQAAKQGAAFPRPGGAGGRSKGKGTPAASTLSSWPLSQSRPCGHNEWVRTSRMAGTQVFLQCKTCQVTWRTDLSWHTKCPDHFSGSCELKDECPHVHIYRVQSKKRKAWKRLNVVINNLTGTGPSSSDSQGSAGGKGPGFESGSCPGGVGSSSFSIPSTGVSSCNGFVWNGGPARQQLAGGLPQQLRGGAVCGAAVAGNRQQKPAASPPSSLHNELRLLMDEDIPQPPPAYPVSQTPAAAGFYQQPCEAPRAVRCSFVPAATLPAGAVFMQQISPGFPQPVQGAVQYVVSSACSRPHPAMPYAQPFQVPAGSLPSQQLLQQQQQHPLNTFYVLVPR